MKGGSCPEFTRVDLLFLWIYISHFRTYVSFACDTVVTSCQNWLLSLHASLKKTIVTYWPAGQVKTRSKWKKAGWKGKSRLNSPWERLVPALAQAWNFLECFFMVLEGFLALIHENQSSGDWLVYSTVATRGINFGILIKIPQKVELDLP